MPAIFVVGRAKREIGITANARGKVREIWLVGFDGAKRLRAGNLTGPSENAK